MDIGIKCDLPQDTPALLYPARPVQHIHTHLFFCSFFGVFLVAKSVLAASLDVTHFVYFSEMSGIEPRELRLQLGALLT